MKESRPDVGSSMKRRGGSIISSVPTESLFLSPPTDNCSLLSWYVLSGNNNADFRVDAVVD